MKFVEQFDVVLILSSIAICSSFPVALKAYIALIYAACCSLPYVSFASLSSATTVQWQLVFWQTKFPIKKGAFLEKRLEHKQQREETK